MLSQTVVQDRFFNSNGVRLRFTIHGQGAPMVLLHGFLGDIETSWIGSPYGPQPNLIPILARHYQVIGLDCRAHGKSDKPHDSSQYGSQMADDVVRLLDTLNIGQTHLAGYSMGALIAGKVLTNYPDRINRVILGGGAVYAAGLFPNGKNPEDETMASELEQGRGIVSYLLSSAPEGQPAPTQEQAEAISRFVLEGKDITALVALARSMWRLGVSDTELAASRVPTLAIIGTRDEGLAHVHYAKTRMANLEVKEIKGADHISTLTHPLFLQNIQQFLGKTAS